jgi:hypothetical protein
MYNFGIERGITQNMTIAVNYVGNGSHFMVDSGVLPSGANANARGYWTNELNPAYLAALGPVTDSTGKSPLLSAKATPDNVAILESKMPGAPSPAFFVAAAQVSSAATIQQMLVHFPQYSGVSDTWGNVGNFSYNSLQVTLQQRLSHGLTFNVNYTYAKNIGDDGTFRSGFDIPSSAISGGARSWKMDRIDRSWTVISIPQSLHAFGVYELPFGKGHFGNDSRAVRWLAGGWQLSGIYTYAAGTPMAVIWSGCNGAVGQCMPDLNASSSAFAHHNARINGSFGKGANGYQAANLGKMQYIDPTAFATPSNVSSVSTPQYLIGNAPRTKPLNLNNPGTWDIDSGLRRTFPIHERLNFVFEADCLNTTNHVTFSGPNVNWSQGSTSFGTVGGIANSPAPRDWQFAGHINF